jgi:3-methylfumaryl-CoA hydratase
MSEQVVRSGTLKLEPTAALAGVIGAAVPTASLPALWHMVYLLEIPAETELGPDWHPLNGVPQPPALGMRRMFAGGRFTTHELLELTKLAIRKTSVIASVEKQGRAGKLVFVAVQHRYEQDGVIKVDAEDDIVCRPAAEQTMPSAEITPAERVASDSEKELLTIDVDSRPLFRFSALTYNAHRIHSDRNWCEREGYHGLVIHGPLQALLMAEPYGALISHLSAGRSPTDWSAHAWESRASPSGHQGKAGAPRR